MKENCFYITIKSPDDRSVAPPRKAERAWHSVRMRLQISSEQGHTHTFQSEFKSALCLSLGGCEDKTSDKLSTWKTMKWVSLKVLSLTGSLEIVMNSEFDTVSILDMVHFNFSLLNWAFSFLVFKDYRDSEEGRMYI